VTANAEVIVCVFHASTIAARQEGNQASFIRVSLSGYGSSPDEPGMAGRTH
jgi:hypothetical protein